MTVNHSRVGVACTLLAALLLPSGAGAAPFSVPIDIEDEYDIDQLYLDGEIEADERDQLLALFYSQLDLNLATRDELYELPGMTYTLADKVLEQREKRGRYYRVSELLGVEGMTQAIYDQIEPFVSVTLEETARRGYDGAVTLGVVGRTKEIDPSVYLHGKARFLEHGGVNLLLMVRPMIGKVNDAQNLWNYYTESSGDQRGIRGDVLSAPATAMRFDFAGLNAYWDGSRLSVIGGSYRVGFGLGLTMDNSNRRRPHGWYPQLQYSTDIDGGKVRPFQPFMGVAARYKRLELGAGHLDATVFGSFWNRDLYQTDVYYERCPVEKAFSSNATGATTYTVNDSCSKSEKRMPTLVDQDPYPTGAYPNFTDPGHRSLYFEYPTLPGIMREIVGGANLTYWFTRRAAMGITGYVGNWHMNAKAPGLAPNVASKYPFTRQTYGAVGLNGRIGFGRQELAAEATVTDQGMPAVLVKGWLHPHADFEVIPALRYYHDRYDNPYNRGDANADEFQGNRARDELGGRVQVKYRPLKWLRLRLDLDVWYHKFPALRINRNETDPDRPGYIGEDGVITVGDAQGAVDLEGQFRVQINPTSKEKITFWTIFHDEDLSRGGRSRSYSYDEDDWGGSKVYWAVSASTTRIPRLRLAAYFKQTFEDVSTLETKFDHHWYAWFQVKANLQPGPTVAARVKYYDFATPQDDTRWVSSYCEDWIRASSGDWPSYLPGECRGESFVESYLQLTQKLPTTMFAGSLASLRVNWLHWTDSRSRWGDGAGGKSDELRDRVTIKGYVTVKF